MKGFRSVMLLAVLFALASSAHAETINEWWRTNCKFQPTASEEGKISPFVTMEFEESEDFARIGTPFKVLVRGNLTKHATLSGSDAQVTLGQKMCLDGTTPYGTDGCPAQGETGKYNFLHSVTIGGQARNVAVKSTDGGVLFPGEEGPSKSICKLIKVQGAAALPDASEPEVLQYEGAVIDSSNARPLTGVTVNLKSEKAIAESVSCPSSVTDASGSYRFSDIPAACKDGVRWLEFTKTDYIGSRLTIEDEFREVIPLFSMRPFCQQPDTSGTPPPPPTPPAPGQLLVNGSSNAVETMSGDTVTFTVANAVSGQVDACYQVLHHPNAPGTDVSESTACTDWYTNWTAAGNGEWRFNASNNTLVGTFAPNASWNIPGLKVRASFRKSGTNDVVTATLIVTQPDPNRGSYRWRGPHADFSPLPPACTGTLPSNGQPCSQLGKSCTMNVNDVYTCENPSASKSSSCFDGSRFGLGCLTGSEIQRFFSDIRDGIVEVANDVFEWVRSIFDSLATLIGSYNVASVTGAAWNGFDAKTLQGKGYLEFIWNPSAAGRDGEAVYWSWAKVGGGQTAGKKAYVWLTDERDILVAGDPNFAHNVDPGELGTNKLALHKKYRLHYSFPTQWSFNLNGNPRAANIPLWNGFDNRTITGTGQMSFMWNPALGCGAGTKLQFKWNRVGSDSVDDAGAKIWLTDAFGAVIAGGPNSIQQGTLQATGLIEWRQYVLRYALGSTKMNIIGVMDGSALLTNGDGCPAGFQAPSDLKNEVFGGYGNVNRVMNYSGQVVSFLLPAQGTHTGGSVSIGENPTSPQGWDIDGNGNIEENEKMVIQVSINKCKGYVDPSPYQTGSSTLTNYCNLSSQNGAFNKISYVYETDSNFTSKEMVNRYGYCWVGDGGQYYINARWTFPQCPHGAATCGFSFQHNLSGYPRPARPTGTASSCTTSATYTDAFDTKSQRTFRLRPGETAAMAFKTYDAARDLPGAIKLSTIETTQTPTDADHEIRVSQCPGDFTSTCGGFANSKGASVNVAVNAVTSACQLDSNKTYYMNVRQVKRNDPTQNSCSLSGGCDVNLGIQNYYPNGSPQACTTSATYNDTFTQGAQKIVYRLKNGESAATAFKVISERGGKTVDVSTTETVNTPPTSHEITISQCQGDFDVPEGCKQFVMLNGTLVASFDRSIWWARCFVDVGKTYYMNVRPKLLDGGSAACRSSGGCDIRVQIQPTNVELDQTP